MSAPREEVQAAVDAYVAMRDRIEAGHADWPDMAELFTDDATYIDPAWGRVDGIDDIREFMAESMAGLEDWRFPIDWVAIDGDHVIVKWTQLLPGTRADGTPYANSGLSDLTYAGNGRFSRSEDFLNMLHVHEVIQESGWKPGPGFTPPPTHPPRI
jgi:ketosteroid isomerase-like protein